VASVAPFSRSAAARRKADEIQSWTPALSAPLPLAPGRLWMLTLPVCAGRLAGASRWAAEKLCVWR